MKCDVLFSQGSVSKRSRYSWRQSARMSKIKNGGLEQYGDELFEQQQFGTASTEWLNTVSNVLHKHDCCICLTRCFVQYTCKTPLFLCS